MAGAAITILYEDQRGETRTFGLHTFVKACVFDAINGDRRRFEASLDDARPLKGVQNVLRACRDDIDLIAADGRSVVAVIDDDAIREQLKLPRDATEARVALEIKKGSRAPDRLSVVLIKKNMESVIEAAGVCEPGLDAQRLDRAVRHKDLLERDAILIELSRERARPVRDCVLGRVPSLRTLVALLGGMLRPDEKEKPAAARATSKRTRSQR